MPVRDIVVIGGSAGSIGVIKQIVSSLPATVPAAVFVVVHLGARTRSFLPDILNSSVNGGELRAREAEDGERIANGRIYIAPPDRHLIVARDHVHLARSPKEGFHRPSINVTFRSAARTYGNRVIGVLVSGLQDDGVAGLWEIGRHHGVTIVQDPDEAQFPAMPVNALREAPINYRLRTAEIGPVLTGLISGIEMPGYHNFRPDERREDRFVGFTCPECHGPLAETQAHPAEFQCRTGHVFSLKTLFEEHTSVQERKMYEAILALEEGASLADYTADTRPQETNQEALRKEAEQLRRHAVAIRRLLEERIIASLD
ncbi:MAG: chemotaxis protein CheB [Bryobacterales bacterium]|nr:chemotaxis protein CheB [Bryobacterales bacterium]